VQGRTTIARGAADAGVLVAAHGATFGLAASVDGNPRLGALDPGLGARNAVWEAARNVAAVGAWPWALTDCLNYGRPTDPAVMGQLEAGIDGLAEAARAAGTLPERAAREPLEDWLARCKGALPALPFVSGNVSLYNEDDQGRAVPHSPIVACVGLVPDVARTTTPGLKAAGNALVFVGGSARGHLGGSLFAERRGRAQDPTLAPAPEWGEEGRAHLALALGLVHDGIARACHDVSGGGLAQALCEMAFASGAGLGFAVDARSNDVEWFSEEPGFVLEIPPAELARVRGLGAVEIGSVTADGRLRFGTVALDRAALAKSWGEALEAAFETREEALA
jgi:phosphoribosylformylglycinamidine synthase